MHIYTYHIDGPNASKLCGFLLFARIASQRKSTYPISEVSGAKDLPFLVFGTRYPQYWVLGFSGELGPKVYTRGKEWTNSEYGAIWARVSFWVWCVWLCPFGKTHMSVHMRVSKTQGPEYRPKHSESLGIKTSKDPSLEIQPYGCWDLTPG